jgi:hypothetical protein
VELLHTLAFLYGYLPQAQRLPMTRVDQLTRVLEGEYGSVLLRTLSGFRPMRRQDVFSLHVVVAEETIGGLGLCPIPTRLID